MKKRIWILFSAFSITLFGICAYLATINTEEVIDVADKQSAYAVSVASLRGTIYDRNLQPLTNVDMEYRAAVAPDETLLTQLRPFISESTFQSLKNAMRDRKPTMIRLQGPIGIFESLRQFLVPVRYGKQQLASHLIGYLNAEGTNGVTGLEYAYDDMLNQQRGEIVVSFAVDGAGTWLQGATVNVKNTVKTAKSGIVLTIDRDIQKIVEETTPQYLQKGTVIVLDPEDSAILAMASFPAFHPDRVEESILADDGALLNRALSLYDCGSVFKVISTAAALNAGFSVMQEYDCPGGLAVENNLFHCHNRLGHQKLNFLDAFAVSCNLYYINVIRDVGARQLYDTMKQFGLFDSIQLANGIEAGGCIAPTVFELQQSPAALANISFGQGRLLISPLHIAQMTAAIANEGILHRPYLVKGIAYTDDAQPELKEEGRGERILNAEKSHIIQEMMRQVVTRGTGQKAAPKHCTAAGKTGTAETGQMNENGSPVVQSWFTGYIPSENPQYVITVLAENAEQTGADSATLFCEISDKLIS